LPEWRYSITGLDPAKTAKASGRDLRISPKAAREICYALRKMKLEEGKKYLESVIEKKTAVPFRRHKKEIPHRRGLQGWYAGKYPVRAAREILKVLNCAEANAEEKGLDTEKLKIIHIASQRAMKIRKAIPRAHGRSSAYNQELTHIELVVMET
jgi:large subunit ribosomal protein L22